METAALGSRPGRQAEGGQTILSRAKSRSMGGGPGSRGCVPEGGASPRLLAFAEKKNADSVDLSSNVEAGDRLPGGMSKVHNPDLRTYA